MSCLPGIYRQTQSSLDSIPSMKFYACIFHLINTFDRALTESERCLIMIVSVNTDARNQREMPCVIKRLVFNRSLLNIDLVSPSVSQAHFITVAWWLTHALKRPLTIERRIRLFVRGNQKRQAIVRVRVHMHISSTIVWRREISVTIVGAEDREDWYFIHAFNLVVDGIEQILHEFLLSNNSSIDFIE